MTVLNGQYARQYPQDIARVFTTETGALTKGYGMVWDNIATVDSVAVTVNDPARSRRVVNPSATKNKHFAGVLTQSYAANAAGQLVDIALPGENAYAEIYLGASSATIGDVFTCDCGDTAGPFYAAGFPGKGTVNVATEVSAAGLVWARLQDGPESGLVQTLTPVAAGGAIAVSPRGLTRISGGTVNTADITDTLADDVLIGERKCYEIIVLIGNSKDLVVTLATTGEQLDGTTDLDTVTLDAEGDRCLLEWRGSYYQLIQNTGGALA